MTLHDLIGHSAHPPLQPNTQSLFEHMQGVARRAAAFASAFDSEAFGEWLGWWHDAGKAAPDVQSYLRGETDAKHGPDHSSVGMLKASITFPPLAFNVAGHHGGLADRVGEAYDGLQQRIERKRAEDRIVAALTLADSLLRDLAPVLRAEEAPAFLRPAEPGAARRTAFWIRMLHAALVDADCLDTEQHFQPDQATLRRTPHELAALWAKLEKSQKTLMTKATGEVNEVRRVVYEACLARSADPPGVFSLTVPTGGGKTRSAMAFALCHALRHGLRRVIIALPYTSIIEQNADVYRQLFGETAVLEHHSAVFSREQPGKASEAERWARLAAENWDAPIVVTTTVQLFESLFSHRNSRIRKLHNIANSVIILDEVQTLPPHLLRPTLEVLAHLVEAYGVTLLLCTATQPALQTRPGFDGLTGVREILPDPLPVFKRLRRVDYEHAWREPWPWERVAATCFSADQAMVVLNTIRDAMALLDACAGRNVLHLSAQLCGAHRRVVLDDVRRRLDRGRPVHLIATQVVEAGVDIDFPLVMRALGPLDRIIQAAGRCNREGRRATGRVVLFEPAGGSVPPGAYRTGTGVTQTLLATDPPPDLHDPALPLRYFRMLYRIQNLDDRGIRDKLDRLQFEEVGRAYQLIDDDMVAVVVPYDPPGHRGDRLRLLERIRRQGRPSRHDYRMLQPYLVNLRGKLHEQAQAQGLCEEWVPGVWIWHGAYDPLRGLQMELPFLEDPVI